MKYSTLILFAFTTCFSFAQKKTIKAIYVEYDYSKLNLDPNQNQYGRLFPDTIYFDSLGRKTYENIGGDGFSTNVHTFTYKDGKLNKKQSKNGGRNEFFYSTNLDSTKGYGNYNRLLNEHYFLYDDSGRVVFERAWYPVIKSGDSSKLQYGPNWVREQFYSTPIKSFDKQTFYNEHGDPKEIYEFMPEGTFCEKFEYTYDKQGNWLTKTTKTRTKDNNGERSEWDADYYIVRRRIVYW